MKFYVKKPRYRVRGFLRNGVVLCGNPSRKHRSHGAGWGNGRRRAGEWGCVQLQDGEAINQGPWELMPLTAQPLSAEACRVALLRPASFQGSLLSEPPTLPQPTVPLQGALALSFSARALLLLAVKTETFYSVHKPEVTQLNETICHIKFTSAGIKRQITQD